MERIQWRIQNEYLGEQPVGTAFIEPTANKDYPFVCHAPTMRVPGSIEGTDKVYAATFAALVAIYRHNAAGPALRIESVALPAMGTGFGFVPFDECARQMAVAYRNYLEPPHRLDWDTVILRHKTLSYDGDKRIVSGA